ncbi:retrotransposon ty3-gypsy subclass [Cystoisospora suis]|uniref:Retrotransposon ty3-gypsy subclass n=1 Tax=Cystoisospora suis TaxID=483139 RepID=A0A2C6KLF3_9APIC|nr:retrotransposon ty3-gypsy subclass [Cystoisospora suis]
MDRDIENFVKSCVACARGKASHQKGGGLLHPLAIPVAAWEEIRMDLILGLPTTREGHDAIVTIVCRLTKMAHFIPCVHTISAQELAKMYSLEK